MRGMKLIEFDMQDEAMRTAMLPLYQTYEAEISEEDVLDEHQFYPMDSLEELLEHFEEYFEGKTTFICVIDGKYRGFVTFHVDSKKTPGYGRGYKGWGHLSEIYTDKQSRRLGLGRAMVKKAEEELMKLGVKDIYLMNLLTGNEAFWKSLGYTYTGKKVPEEDGLIFENRHN